MANYCSTDYALEGELDNVKKLASTLMKLVKKNRGKQTGEWKTNPNWIGFIVADILKERTEDYACRGEFGIDEDSCIVENGENSALKFFTSTAWNNENDIIKALANKFSLRMYYQSLETGENIYETNDREARFFKDRYYLQTPEGDGTYETEGDAIKAVLKVAGKKRAKKGEGIEELCRRLSTDDDFYYVWICDEVEDDDNGSEDDGCEEFFIVSDSSAKK